MPLPMVFWSDFHQENKYSKEISEFVFFLIYLTQSVRYLGCKDKDQSLIPTKIYIKILGAVVWNLSTGKTKTGGSLGLTDQSV